MSIVTLEGICQLTGADVGICFNRTLPRTVQIIKVGDTVRKNCITSSGHGVLGIVLQILGDHRVVVVGETTTINRSLGAPDFVKSNSGY